MDVTGKNTIMNANNNPPSSSTSSTAITRSIPRSEPKIIPTQRNPNAYNHDRLQFARSCPSTRTLTTSASSSTLGTSISNDSRSPGGSASSSFTTRAQRYQQLHDTPPTMYLSHIDSREFRKAMTERSGFVFAVTSDAEDLAPMEYEVQVFEIKLDE